MTDQEAVHIALAEAKAVVDPTFHVKARMSEWSSGLRLELSRAHGGVPCLVIYSCPILPEDELHAVVRGLWVSMQHDHKERWPSTTSTTSK